MYVIAFTTWAEFQNNYSLGFDVNPKYNDEIDWTKRLREVYNYLKKKYKLKFLEINKQDLLLSIHVDKSVKAGKFFKEAENLINEEVTTPTKSRSVNERNHKGGRKPTRSRKARNSR